MRRNIDGTCSGDPCCKPRNIRTINTMNPDDSGNFTIRGDQGIHVTVGTNEIIISGIAVYYDNLDGNLVIDNDAMTIDLANDISIAGDMIIAGDLTVNGTYYTVHAEHVYTEDDYIIMRNGAVTGLGSGQYSGFQVTKYDGTNDGRLVIDNSGTARVGDVGDEQPLLTREEAANLNNGALLKWDSANSKAIDEGTVGSDTQPIKIVNGVATPVTTALTPNTYTTGTGTAGSALASGSASWIQFGKLVMVMLSTINTYATGYNQQLVTNLPIAASDGRCCICDGAGANVSLLQIGTATDTIIINNPTATGTFFGTMYYIAQ